MKKKDNGMSPDMLNDAMSSTPISVFTATNDADKNDAPVMFSKVQNVPDDIQNELIKIDFDKQTVSARALYAFFASTERFYPWCRRYFSFGLVENIDFTAASFFLSVNNGAKQDIGDYLLTIEAAKHIAMVQRNEKGKQARQYFINVEKLYLKTISNKQTDVKSVSLFENWERIAIQFDNLRSSIALLEKENSQQQQLQKNYDSLVEKTIVLEKKFVEQATFYNFKEEYIERTISKKIDLALKASFREADQLSGRDEIEKMLPHATNQKSVVVLNQLEKTIQKTTLEEDLVLKYYRPSHRKTENALFFTATEITHRLEWFSKRVTVRNVGMALKKLGFERVPHSQKGGKMKGYFVIQLF